MITKYIDQLFLELSQFSNAKTKREIQLERIITVLSKEVKREVINKIIHDEYYQKYIVDLFK